MAKIIRKLTIGETPYHPKAVHYEVNSRNPMKINDVPHRITLIRRDDREKIVNNKDIWDIFIINEETREEFEWKTVKCGSDYNYYEESLINFD